MCLHGRKLDDQLTASSSLARCTMKIAGRGSSSNSSSSSSSSSNSCVIIILISNTVMIRLSKIINNFTLIKMLIKCYKNERSKGVAYCMTPPSRRVSGSDSGQVAHTHMPLSPSSIICCQSKGAGALQLGSYWPRVTDNDGVSPSVCSWPFNGR